MKQDLTKGSIWKNIVLFALPLMVGNLFQQLYSTVDTIIVGNFVGKQALAAVGSTDPIINTFIGLFMGLSNGAGVVIAQYYGARDKNGVQKAVACTIALTGILCVFCTALALVLLPWLLRLLGTPSDVWSSAYGYLSIYFAGLSGLLFYNMGSGILRSAGDSRRPLYFLMFSACMNIVLDLLFVAVFHMGVKGAAAATILTQFMAAGLVLLVLTKEKDIYRIQWKLVRLYPDILRSIFAIGLPSALQMMVTSFSNVFIQSYINAFGSSAMAGWSSYAKLDKLALLPMQSIALSVTTFTGQNLGAGKPERARKGVRIALLLSISVAVAISIPIVAFAPFLVGLFNQDGQVIAYGTRIIHVIMPCFWVIGFNQVFSSALQGSGSTRIPVLIMMSCFILFRQAYLFVLTRLTTSFALTVFGYPAGWFLCSLSMSLYYRHADLMAHVITHPEADLSLAAQES